MNQIPKFRAWHKELKKMREVWKIHWAAPNRIHHVSVRLEDIDRHPITKTMISEDWFGFPENNQIELMQWSGLQDKNGKDIYEHDIIRINPDALHNWNPDMCITEIWVMEFRNYSWFPFAHGLPAPSELEVIGNIYENEDLLNVSKR